MTKTMVMYDDVNVSLIPADAEYIAAYADGRYENVDAIKKRFPKAHIVLIDVRASYHNGDVLDVEKGDATNDQAPEWFKLRKGKTKTTAKPVLYTSASNITQLVKTMASAGISRDQYLIWSAHYTLKSHICNPSTCGYAASDATQWTDKSHGKSLDESIVNDNFFKATKPKKVKTPEITKAIAANKALDKILGEINNTKTVNERIARMRKTLARQLAYLEKKEVK